VSVAVSTLVTAALFNPLRRRVQRAVDHRFNRSRYNAEAVVAAYTARLRHSVELDVIQRDLIGVPRLTTAEATSLRGTRASTSPASPRLPAALAACCHP
jgi:hypothetical protein